MACGVENSYGCSFSLFRVSRAPDKTESEKAHHTDYRVTIGTNGLSFVSSTGDKKNVYSLILNTNGIAFVGSSGEEEKVYCNCSPSKLCKLATLASHAASSVFNHAVSSVFNNESKHDLGDYETLY